MKGERMNSILLMLEALKKWLNLMLHALTVAPTDAAANEVRQHGACL
jgi:hypothetical protein